MTQQTEAQRLADALDLYATGDKHQKDIEDAAAELRRLEAENEMFRVMHQSHADKLKAVGAINAQLLEALEFIANRQNLMFAECSDAEEIIEVARAAIAAVKDGNAA